MPIFQCNTIGLQNGKRNVKRPYQLRPQEAAPSTSEEGKQAAVQSGRDGADTVRETRIYGETALNSTKLPFAVQ
ncbi:hypothetical protein [Candidatus Nitrosoglobus terrae]